jgi:cytochrome P450
MVLLSFPAANRDPAVFPDADKVIIDRTETGIPRSASAFTAASGQISPAWK